MNHLITFVVSIVVWLGIFENHLIEPLMVLPVGYVLNSLTGADYVLLVATFFALTALITICDVLLVLLKRHVRN